MSSPERGLASLVIVIKQNKAGLKKIIISSLFILKYFSATVTLKREGFKIQYQSSLIP